MENLEIIEASHAFLSLACFLRNEQLEQKKKSSDKIELLMIWLIESRPQFLLSKKSYFCIAREHIFIGQRKTNERRNKSGNFPQHACCWASRKYEHHHNLNRQHQVGRWILLWRIACFRFWIFCFWKIEREFIECINLSFSFFLSYCEKMGIR